MSMPAISQQTVQEQAPEPLSPKEPEKTVFNLTLKSFDASSKAKLIREIKSLLNLGLVEAKTFVESSPKLIGENIKKEDAEKMKKTLEDLGAVIEMN